MAHFAKIENNIVTNVIVINNQDIKDKEFPESESLGQDFIKSIGLEGKYLQTSYNNNFRKKYAGIGDEWHADLDAFVSPPEFESWTLNEETFEYEAPIPYPTDGKSYLWNEEKQNWEET